MGLLPVILLAACDTTEPFLLVEGDDIACDSRDTGVEETWVEDLETVHGCGWHIRALDRRQTGTVVLTGVTLASEHGDTTTLDGTFTTMLEADE